MRDAVVILTPEPPYPLRGGGGFRIASLLHYFARFCDVDLVFFSDSAKAAEMPAGLVRRQSVIPLPVHGRGVSARYFRNAKRAIRGIPPLNDRVAGLESEVRKALEGRRYRFGIAEHFWVSGYRSVLAEHCDEVVLDLHNIESILHARSAETATGLVALGHRRFAQCSRALEAKRLPQFSFALATSESDRREALEIAPSSNIAVYPNSYPFERRDLPAPIPNRVVFSGNFEYHPNIDAVGFLLREIWPQVLEHCPEAQLCLVGRGCEHVAHLTRTARNVLITGPVEDALAEIARGSVVIAPLRTGSGTRVKILEAWAANRPVVATPVAAEGLEVQNGRNITLEASSRGFASEVCRLLGDAQEGDRLARAGRDTLTAKYTWEAAWKALDEIPQVARFRELSGYNGDFDALRR